MKRTMCATLMILSIVTATLGQSTTEKKNTAAISFESSDASQFGYSPWDQGLRVTFARWFSERLEGIASGGLSNAEKAYIGEGKHADGSIGVRVYITKSVFGVGGGTIGRDWNPDYTKWALRGYIGVGAKLWGFIATVSFFSPPSDLTVDPNQVKGFNLQIEYFRPIAGSFGAYGSFQGSLASFNQTGGSLDERITGAIWKGRAGFYFSF